MLGMLKLYRQKLLIRGFPGIARPNFECHFCSFGGAGTSMVMEFAGRYHSTNDMQDVSGYKHIPFPPRHPTTVKKVVYVYGSPTDATISLFRRGFGRIQAHRNGNPFWLRDISLEEYAAIGRDRLLLEKHFTTWTNPSLRNYPVLLVRYERIWQNLREIFGFLDIPLEDMDQFPRPRQRESTGELFSGNLRQRLDRIYAGLTASMAKFSDVQIR